MNEHLRNNNMTYWQHFRFASRHAAKCLAAALQLLVHAVYPGVFQFSGRRLVVSMLRDFDGLDNSQ